MNYKALVSWFRKKKKGWMESHALRQKDFSKKKSMGYGDISWNPFK